MGRSTLSVDFRLVYCLCCLFFICCHYFAILFVYSIKLVNNAHDGSNAARNLPFYLEVKKPSKLSGEESLTCYIEGVRPTILILQDQFITPLSLIMMSLALVCTPLMWSDIIIWTIPTYN